MMDLEEYIFDDDGNPILQCPVFPQEKNVFADEPDCKDIFHVKGDGFDVTLSLARGLITWTNVNPGGKKKSLFKGKGKHKSEDRRTLMLKDVFGVKTKRKKTNTSTDEEGMCIGFSLYIVEECGPNTLGQKCVVFEHPSEGLCGTYVRKIQSYISEIQGRPKSVKLFLQAHAGARHGNTVYKTKVLPMFQAADIHVDCVEVQHNEHIKQEMVHINLEDFDCIIAMGGDGTVSKAADGLMTATQKYKDIEQKYGFTPNRAFLPFGIIPTGSTNDVARSVMGTDDVISAVLYIILGRTTPVDIMSVYREDKFMQWCFNSQYGFAGNVLAFRKRYKAIGKFGLEPAFVKALTKAKLRAYKCDVEYIPAESIHEKSKYVPCYRGCEICWNEQVVEDNGVTQDLVQAFDPLDESNTSDTLVDLAEHEESPWRTKKLDFMNISVLTNPARSEMAPRGMSKFTHLNDGVIDLILIKETERKEFIRLLKRLSNTKNQFDFPFVETIRAKEVRFRLRLPTGFKYSDNNFSEIDYEINRKKNLVNNASKSMEILEINDLSDSDDDASSDTISQRAGSSTPTMKSSKPAPFRKSQSVQVFSKKSLKRTNTETSIEMFNSDDSDDDDDDDIDDDDDDNNSDDGSGEIVSVNRLGVRTVKSAQAADQHLVGPAYRPTFAEQDRAKRKKRQQKKEEKRKAKEELKMKSVWNIDNEVKEEDVLSFKVHHGLFRIYGLGISPESVYSESTLLCVPRI